MRINTNIASLNAQRQMSLTTRALARALARLSSGQRISEARDDASGLAIATNLEAQARGYNRAIKNANEAGSYLAAADGVLSSQLNLVQRLREIALQASNGTMSEADRRNLSIEFNQLLEEIDRLATDSSFNGSHLLDGSFATMNLQVGSRREEQIQISLGDSRSHQLFVNEEVVGLGTFEEGSPISTLVPGVTLGAVGRDLNNDGLADIVHHQAAAGIVAIRLNEGDGAFSALQTYAMGIAGAPNFADFNNDGYLDLYFSNASYSSFTYVLNQGDGTFGARMSLNVGSNSTTYIQDVNGDGSLDVLVLDAANRVRQHLNNGSGIFGSATTTNGFIQPESVSFDDINGDGYVDILSIYDIAQDGTGYENAVYLGNSSGTYSLSRTFFLGDQTSVTAGLLLDINGDGQSDFVQRSGDSSQIYVYLGTSTGLAAAAVTSSFGTLSPQFADINGDGYLDAVGINGGNIATRLGTASGAFSAGQTLTDLSGAYSPYVSDHDGDGDMDIVATNGTLTGTWRNNGSGSFSLAATSAGAYGYLATDFNNDGLLDNWVFTYLQIVLQEADGSLNPGPVYNPGPYGAGINYADFNGDGALEFIVTQGTWLTSNGDVKIYTQLTETLESAAQMSVESQADAKDALDVIDGAIHRLLSQRALIGAQQSRLESVVANLQTSVQNVSSARSQIMDADLAIESAELIRLQILQAAQSTVLSQANLSLQTVLSLLWPTGRRS